MSIVNNKYLSFVCSFLLGTIFLVSAFAKAWDGEAFADMLLRYGPRWFSIGAPVIILIETVLGMMLILRLKVRWCAWASDLFLIFVSAVFAYGWLAKGITECGCFGALSSLYESKPYITFVRNAVMLCISVPLLSHYERKESSVWLKMCAVVTIAALTCFLCGLSMRKSFVLPKWSAVRSQSGVGAIEKLQTVYPFSADSTYFVYLFSFTCPHCQNSIANVQQYQQFNVVDKVIGIAVENEEAQERFYRIYQPQIEIITIPKDTMKSITNHLPIGLILKENKIQKAEGGFINSPGLNIK